MKPFMLPEGFLLGTATAPLQIEGGDRNNSWYRWVEQGHAKEGHCVIACDHWNRVAEDTALMADLGHHTYRMGVEWSRIEPERGRFDAEAMAHYRREVEGLVSAGIVPLITLHHFSNPLWLEDSGSWANPEVADLFERYSEYVVRALGDLCVDWVTINEPSVYAAFGYLTGNWPPGKSDLRECLKVARNMVLGHIRAYRRIHEVRGQMGYGGTMVGVAHHVRAFEPAHGYPQERLAARLIGRLFEDMFTIAMTEGRFVIPLGRGYPLGRRRYSDFIGLNYYSREMVSFTWNSALMFAKMETKAGVPINDLGWEIYPEGLYHFCKKYWNRYHLPIYITENGTCDAKDAFRARFIYDHLLQVKRLLDEGVDVRRYYHWTFTDNFEWEEGTSARFGLVEVDYSTQERTVRPSGWFFADICRNHGVTDEMLKEYEFSLEPGLQTPA